MKIETLIIVNSGGSKVFINTNQITTIREQKYYKNTIITTSAGEKVETTESFDSLISKLTGE